MADQGPELNYKIDVLQDGETNADGEMIIIYNYDGAELTPELLAKTLEELSAQTSLNRTTLNESFLLAEPQSHEVDNPDTVKVESANGVLYAADNSVISVDDFSRSSALLSSNDGWERLRGEPSLKLEVIAQDAATGTTIASSAEVENSLPHIESIRNEGQSDEKSNAGCSSCFSNLYASSTSDTAKNEWLDNTDAPSSYFPENGCNELLQDSVSECKASEVEKEANKIEYSCEDCEFVTFAEIELQRHKKVKHNAKMPFICFFCSKEFKLELSLDIHKLSHTTQNDAQPNLKYIHKVSKFFSCPLCDFQYQRKPQLMMHMANIHKGDDYIFCNECNYSCLSEGELLTHKEKTSHKDERTLCPLCGASTKNLRQHVRTAHNESRPYVCKTCGFRAKTATNLKTHMNVHDPVKKIKCQECPYRCRTKDQLKKHLVRHSKEKNFKCSRCAFACKTAMSLKRHMLIHGKPDNYLCKMCNFSTPDKLILKEHKKTQHKLKPQFICRECSLEFKRPLELRKHALSVHKSDKSQFCSYCAFSCDTLNELRAHMEQHFGKFSFVCTFCGYSTRIKASYRRHIERHNKVKNFKCPHCDYACVEKYDLQKHVAHRHSEEKPYSCPYCPYSCKFKPRLNNHISFIHSDEKPFFCKLCPYTGKSAESLKKHMVHHGVVPVTSKAIQCVLCDFATHERAKLRRHMKGHVNKAFIEIQTVG